MDLFSESMDLFSESMDLYPIMVTNPNSKKFQIMPYNMNLGS